MIQLARHGLGLRLPLRPNEDKIKKKKTKHALSTINHQLELLNPWGKNEFEAYCIIDSYGENEKERIYGSMI